MTEYGKDREVFYKAESQQKAIKKYLLEGNNITPIEAQEMFGCFRLAAIIYNLREHENMLISTTQMKKSLGATHNHASYKVVESLSEVTLGSVA